MNNTKLTATTIAGIAWIEDRRQASYTNGRGWGVRQGNAFLSFNGVRPSVWSTKAIAAEIASTLVDDGTVKWIEVVA